MSGISIEAKNYNLSKGSSGLVNNIAKQYNQRVTNLPKGTKQIIEIDIRGQNISELQQSQIRQNIVQKTSSNVKINFIE